MKRFIALLTILLLLISMGACSFEPEVYVASDKIAVTTTYVKDGVGKITARKTEGADVKALEIACIYFDENGTAIGEYELVSCAMGDSLLDAWETDVSSNTAYMLATVASVTDSNGKKEVCPGVSTWAKETSASFTPATYTGLVLTWETQGAKNENNEKAVNLVTLKINDEKTKISLLAITAFCFCICVGKIEEVFLQTIESGSCL